MASVLAKDRPQQSWITAPQVTPLPEGTTRVSAMLSLLATGGQSAAELAAAAGGIPTGAVSALLHSRMERGQVRRECGIYELVPEYEDELHAKLKAAALWLREHGYVVSRETKA
jgi:hypothetical protein